MVLKLVSQEIREARQSLNWTHERTAKWFGCGIRTYKGWELDGVAPRGFWEPRIARFLSHARKHAKPGAA